MKLAFSERYLSQAEPKNEFTIDCIYDYEMQSDYGKNTDWWKQDIRANNENILPLEVRRESLNDKFKKLSKVWYSETGMLSFIDKKAVHPAYQKIIGMGREALPFIFEEMKLNRGDWFWALEAIVPNDNPAKGESNFKKATEKWLEWAKHQ